MNPWHILDGVCIKRKFISSATATRHAESIGKVQYPYSCPICGAWHLSTAPTRYKTYKRVWDTSPVDQSHPDSEHWQKRLARHKHQQPKFKKKHNRRKLKNL